jgi:Mrp family chromosome partitioning ATPase
MKREQEREMSRQISEEVRQALAQVMHPEIDRNLVDLGMVKDVVVENGKVSVTIALPFLNVPIKDELLRSVRQAVENLDAGLKVEVRAVEMSQKERAGFMTAVDGGPKQGGYLSNIAHVVVVVSGKGGVGKSSVAGMLAVTLRRQGYCVGVLDADITGPSIPKMFGVSKWPASGPLGVMPVESRSGIKLISINLLLPREDEAVVWRGPLISNVIKQFWGEVFWGDLDYLIVDLPPGTSDAALTVMQSIPLSGVVMVTSPQDLAGMVVRKAARMAQHLGAPVLGVVENMSYLTCPNCGAKIEVFGPSQAEGTARLIRAPLLGCLPLDPELAVRCDAGEIEDYPAREFEAVVERIIERMPEEKTRPIFAVK